MRFFRRVFLPVAWLVIFAVAAVSLAVIAFDGDDSERAGAGLSPTGVVPVSEAVVERGTIENSLAVRGSVVVDAPAPVKVAHDGTINHVFVPAGAKVKPGDDLVQIRYEDVPEAASGAEDEEPAKPKVRFVNVAAPAAGVVTDYAKMLGDDVAKGDVLTSVRRNTFRAVGTIAPLDQYRLLGRPRTALVTIPGGPQPFECGDLRFGAAEPATTDETSQPDDQSGGFEADPSGEGGQGGSVPISCRVPSSVLVFDGLGMSMTVDAGKAENALIVPVTAVRGLVKTGSVWVPNPDGGEPVERPVSIGLSDGVHVEITKGLEEGESIVEFVPGGDPADQQTFR